MKLYYAPGACSLSTHIVMREAGFSFDIERVDLQSKLTEGGIDFRSLNPHGYIPLLLLDNGDRISEGVAIMLYLADQAPEANLAPSRGTAERYRMIEKLTFIATELHKGFAPLFNARCPEEWKVVVKEILSSRLTQVTADLAGKPFVMGDRFSVADAYLFTVLSWGAYVGVDIGRWPELANYSARIASRPSVQSALKAEGLV